MKKQQLTCKLGFKKSIISDLSISQLKGGTIGIESADRLYCETENCTHDCATALYTNCNQCPTTC